MYIRKSDREILEEVPGGGFIDGTLSRVLPADVVEVCDLCQTEGSVKDPIAHFKKVGKFGDYTMAHGQCGIDFDLELA